MDLLNATLSYESLKNLLALLLLFCSILLVINFTLSKHLKILKEFYDKYQSDVSNVEEEFTKIRKKLKIIKSLLLQEINPQQPFKRSVLEILEEDTEDEKKE